MGVVEHLALAALVGLFIPVVYCTYNISAHPLRHYPGPKTWAASRIPWCFYQCRGHLPFKLLDLHIRYGAVVRVAPNELSYVHDSAWKTIYGQRRLEMSKDPIFRLHTPTGAQNILVADRETHARQRRLLSHAFSESALREQEPILQKYVSKLIRQLRRRSGDARDPIDMVAWLTFASFDLIGHMCFGENFGCLDTGDHHPFVKAISAMASELTYVQMAKYWGFEQLRQLFVPRAVLGQRKENIGRAMQAVARRIEKGSEHRDFLHYILSANDEKGMSPAEISVNAFSLSIAGSESTATALSGAIFFILSHPPVYQRLVNEIRTAYPCDDEITLATTQKHDYLDAVINETLRMYPPVAITMPRRVPAGGEIIAGQFVPADTSVGVPYFAVFHHPNNFRHPDTFQPERWLGLEEFDGDHRDVMQAFSYGPRSCLGKNIAKAEMRLLLAKLIYNFDWDLKGGQEEWTSQNIQGFWQKTPLHCIVRPVGE